MWAYLRDSGGDSQEQSIPQQQSAIIKYCARHSFTLARLFADEARTGGTDKGRDMFAEMIDGTARPDLRPAGLLIWSLSRFARNQTDAPYYRAMLRKRGIVIHSLTEVLPDDPTAIVIEAVYDFANAEKLRQTSRDVQRGLHSLVAQGYAPGGTPPTGYIARREVIGKKRDGRDRIAPRWVEDPARWELGKQAWRMFAEGATYNELQALTGKLFFRSRCMWAHFFRNPAYLGKLVYGGTEYLDHHPAMVDRATWDRVQARLAINMARKDGNPNNPRRLHRPTLLSGLAVCANCGSAMCFRADRGQAGWQYYICGLKVRRNSAACPTRRINARKADRAVLDGVINQVFTAEMIADLIAATEAQLADTAALDREAHQIDRDLAECSRRIANLLEYLKAFGSGAVQKDLPREEARLAELQYQRQQLTHKREAATVKVTPEAILAVLDQWRGELTTARDSGDVVRARRLLGHFVSEIKLDYNRAIVTFSFQLDNTASERPGSGGAFSIASVVVFQWETR